MEFHIGARLLPLLWGSFEAWGMASFVHFYLHFYILEVGWHSEVPIRTLISAIGLFFPPVSFMQVQEWCLSN